MPSTNQESRAIDYNKDNFIDLKNSMKMLMLQLVIILVIVWAGIIKRAVFSRIRIKFR